MDSPQQPEGTRARAHRRDRAVRRVGGATRWVTLAAAAGSVALATGYAKASATAPDPAEPATSPSPTSPAPSVPSAPAAPTGTATTAHPTTGSARLPSQRTHSAAPSSHAARKPAPAPTTVAPTPTPQPTHTTTGGS
jgi:hypothetical protein